MRGCFTLAPTMVEPVTKMPLHLINYIYQAAPRIENEIASPVPTYAHK